MRQRRLGKCTKGDRLNPTAKTSDDSFQIEEVKGPLCLTTPISGRGPSRHHDAETGRFLGVRVLVNAADLKETDRISSMTQIARNSF